MRVCMLLHKAVDNDSRVTREASALAAAGHNVTVVQLAPPSAGPAPERGFAVRSALPSPTARRLPFHLYRVVFLALFVRRVVELRPDVVHAHDAAMLLPALLGARIAGARVVYDSHELATSVPYRAKAFARFVGIIERIGVPRSAAVITVSDGIADHMRRHYHLHARPAVVRNVCALEPESGSSAGGLRRRLGLDGQPLILHQGAAAPDRGCEALVRAMAEVADAHLVFLGSADPGFDAVLRARVAELGLRDRVHFVASVPLDELLAHTAEADVGVSLLEDTCENHRLALPNKVFEYVAASVPTVASDLPELSALVRGRGIGWTVDARDPGDIARGLREALATPRDALAPRLRAAARELCWAEEQRRLLAVYERLAPTIA
jgi:glycosyltransferase involved in cell wall biosynthesis